MCRKKTEGHYSGVKAGLWYSIGNILIKGIPFFTLPVFTRLLSTADFGVYNTYIAYEGILNVFTGLGIAGTVKTAFFDFKDSFERYISSAVKLILLVTAVFALTGMLSIRFFDIRGWMNGYTMALLILQSMATAVYGVVSIKYVITGEYIKNLVSALAAVLLNIGISLVLLLTGVFTSPALARITGTAAGSIALAIAFIFLQQKKYPLRLHFQENRYALKLGLPLIPHQLALIIMTQCDKLMIQKMAGDSEAGIYSLAVNIVTILTVLLSSVDNAWAPWYYGALDRGDYRVIRKVNSDLLIFFMYLTCGFLMTGTDVIHIMAERAYWDSIHVFIPLSVSVFLNFMYLYDINLEYFCKKTAYISYASILCAGINIALNFVFIKKGGYIAAAYATCTAKFILFLIHHIRAGRLGKEKVVRESGLAAALAVVLFCAMLASVLETAVFARYAVIAAMTAVMAVYFRGQRAG